MAKSYILKGQIQKGFKSESLSNTPFPIDRRVSLYLELISDERGEPESMQW